MPTLTITRMGRVATTHTSRNQCKAIGHHAYSYKVSVTCNAVKATRKYNKQLLDHNDIHFHVTEVFKKGVDSCEMMCIDIANTIQTVLESASIHYLKIYVYIRPLHPKGQHIKAFMEYELSLV